MPDEEFGTNSVGECVQTCPLQQARQGPHWIELRLLDEADEPVPWEEYQVTLPSGEIVHGLLDRNGLARVEQIATAGTCKVSFPRLDKDAWAPMETSA